MRHREINIARELKLNVVTYTYQLGLLYLNDGLFSFSLDSALLVAFNEHKAKIDLVPTFAIFLGIKRSTDHRHLLLFFLLFLLLLSIILCITFLTVAISLLSFLRLFTIILFRISWLLNTFFLSVIFTLLSLPIFLTSISIARFSAFVTILILLTSLVPPSVLLYPIIFIIILIPRHLDNSRSFCIVTH